jgi:hypothetical protein
MVLAGNKVKQLRNLAALHIKWNIDGEKPAQENRNEAGGEQKRDFS